tara:strand:+ start:462 stop:1025 length:564 start_codon:yes stop_codon:yes gene_type:complete
MTTFTEQLEPKGHLEIIKVFPDNTTEVVLDDHNIITHGMGITLAAMFSHDDTSDSFDNFAIPYFQVGDGSSVMASSLQLLDSPLSSGEYGNTEMSISSVNIQGTALPQSVIVMNPAYIFKASVDKVTYSITLDEITANNIEISEVGLFSKNPYLSSPPVAFMCAYRSFTAIPKRDSYTLIFNWTLEF